MEHRWNYIDRGKPKYSGGKPVPVPLCLPQIPHGLTRDRTRPRQTHSKIYNLIKNTGIKIVFVNYGLQAGRSGVSILDGVIGIFHGPGVDSAPNRNEYQEYFLGVKGGRCVGLTNLPPSCADCLEIWKPEPSGTLRVCPGL
jgi:hypothetical protein